MDKGLPGISRRRIKRMRHDNYLTKKGKWGGYAGNGFGRINENWANNDGSAVLKEGFTIR